MAGRALPLISLAHLRSNRRRLRRQLLGGCGRYHKYESERQNRYPDHGPPVFPGIRPVVPPSGHPARRLSVSCYLIFYRHCRALRPFSTGRPQANAARVIHPQHLCREPVVRISLRALGCDFGFRSGRSSCEGAANAYELRNRHTSHCACAATGCGDTSRWSPEIWAVSSVGRASALHAECRRFESVTAHHASPKRATRGAAARRPGAKAGGGAASSQTDCRQKENARRHRNSLRQHAGGERRQTRVCRSAEEGNQIASLSSFEARNATFLLALI
jgi:hypothetical protein